EDSARGPTGGVREEPGRAPPRLAEGDELVQVGSTGGLPSPRWPERVGRLDERDGADGLGSMDLAADLVALLLAERREEVVDVAGGNRRDRADVLLLDVQGP